MVGDGLTDHFLKPSVIGLPRRLEDGLSPRATRPIRDEREDERESASACAYRNNIPNQMLKINQTCPCQESSNRPSASFDESSSLTDFLQSGNKQYSHHVECTELHSGTTNASELQHFKAHFDRSVDAAKCFERLDTLRDILVRFSCGDEKSGEFESI